MFFVKIKPYLIVIQKLTLLPPSGEVAATPPIGDKKRVILSVSEISHDQSEKYILCGNSPSREIAAVAMLPRKDS